MRSVRAQAESPISSLQPTEMLPLSTLIDKTLEKACTWDEFNSWVKYWHDQGISSEVLLSAVYETKTMTDEVKKGAYKRIHKQTS
ncbi:MAG: hypothetical protein ACFFCW_00515 [Candidatus Hodarchaeota archaeon]